MKIRILTAKDVKAALPMPQAIEAVGRAFGQYSAGKAVVPLRTRLHTDKGVTLLMPAYLQQTNELAVKLVSIYGDNPQRGLPTVTAMLVAFDSQTGVPLAIMDGDSLTALRTGAAGGLAAKLLARPDAARVTLFGAGVQGRSQLQAVMAVRDINAVTLVDVSQDAAAKLAAEIGAGPAALDVRVVTDPRKAIEGADIVIAATTTKTPLFDGRHLKPGTHVTGVGSFSPDMQEIDEHTVQRARVVVDSREACSAEAGDIIQSKAVIDAELGEIVNGSKPGRLTAQEITFFKSVGMAAQDAVAAGAVLRNAETTGLGQIVSLS